MFSTILFYLFAIVLVYAAVRVVLARHPVVAVMHLILAFFTASMLWILIGAEFLGLILIIVYVGAVMVLFLFIVMMIDVLPDALHQNFRTYLPLGLVVGGIIVLEIGFVFVSSYLDSGSPIQTPDTYNNAYEIGRAMYTEYAYPIQAGAILLLVGMIAAIAISLRDRKSSKYTHVSEQLKVKPSDRLRVVTMKSEKTVAQEVADEAAKAQAEAKAEAEAAQEQKGEKK